MTVDIRTMREAATESDTKKVSQLKYLLRHFGAVLAMSERGPHTTPVLLGMRVLRGPDWKWGNQDGGEGQVGTIVDIGGGASAKSSARTPTNTVIVQWDNGARTNYRTGHEDAYDVLCFDNGAGGVRQRGVTCAECGARDFFGLRWRCASCPEVDLCQRCYNSDAHDLTHSFRRFDCPESKGTFAVPPRSESRKVTVRGIYPGAKVVRGVDWSWSDQDGGRGSVGDVICVEGWETETANSVAKVFWPKTNSAFQYRLSHKGKCDLKYVPGRSATGGHCYVDHLPVLGRPEPVNFSPKHSKEFTMKKFSLGDPVKITVDPETLRSFQDGHGGFTPAMAELINVPGRVHRFTAAGDVRVQYPGKPENDHRWTVHPAALTKISVFEVGDSVLINSDEPTVRSLQVNHGEWTDTMRMALGKVGKVTKRYTDGDLRVTLGAQTWTFNPACLVSVAKNSPVKSDEVAKLKDSVDSLQLDPLVIAAAKGQLEEIKQRLQQSPPADSRAVRRALLVSAKNGRLEIVQQLCNHFPDQVDMKSGKKTALHAAIHQGHLDVVDLLLNCGAKLSTCDDDGDSSLHYSIYGRQATVMEFLLERGADVNAVNKKDLSALHLAINFKDEECIRVLLKHKVNVNLQDSTGYTALHEMITSKATKSMIDMLFTATDLDPSIINDKGFNCLHYAAKKGSTDVARAILTHYPALAEKRKSDGFAPLHLASLNGSVDIMKLLLNEGRCQIDLRDKLGRTALHLACSQGYYKVLELLLHNGAGGGADPNVRDVDGNTPLHVCLGRDHATQKRTPADLESKPAAEIDQAILSQVQSVSEENRRWVSMALLLVINGADPTLANLNEQGPFDSLRDANARAVLMEATLQCKSSSSSSANTGSSASGQSSETAATDGATALEEEADKDKEVKVECQVCSELVHPVLFKPCGHKIACADCSQRMKKCLECKASIDEKVVFKDQAGAKSKTRSGSEKSSAKVKALEAKVRDLEDQCLCLICMERKKNVVFHCGHGACSECVDTLKSCHMCRGPISNKIYMY